MKIMVVYAYAGIGHKKAADAVAGVLSKTSAIELVNIDVLDYTDGFFKFLYPRIYLFLINRASLLWGLFYYILDVKFIDIFLAPIRRFFHDIYARRFIEFVVGENPDVVVCTHFLPAEVISGLKKRGIFKGKLITIITDFLAHSFWMARYSDYFIAAIERTKNDLVKRGVKEERIRVFGIPCEAKFSVKNPKDTTIEKLGLEKGFLNLLIMGGGFGSGPVKDIAVSIAGMEPKVKDGLQLIVICGKNKKLFGELAALRQDLSVRLTVFGFMDNIDEFMDISDCIITKSGGLTVSESLSKRLPMIIVRPIPGQETRNCNILVGYGTAVCARTTKEVTDNIRDFIAFPEKIIGMKTRANLLSYPNAARDIADFILTNSADRKD